jgi:arsenite-transporting ATPase
LRFLELFDIVRDWLRAFFEVLLKYRQVVRLPQASETLVTMSQRVRRMHHLLTDPVRSRAMLVALPGHAGREETAHLLGALEHCGIRVGTLLVNQVIETAGDCQRCAAAAAEHQRQLAQFRAAFRGLDLAVVPLRSEELRGTEALRSLLQFTASAAAPPQEAASVVLEPLAT